MKELHKNTLFSVGLLVLAIDSKFKLKPCTDEAVQKENAANKKQIACTNKAATESNDILTE